MHNFSNREDPLSDQHNYVDFLHNCTLVTIAFMVLVVLVSCLASAPPPHRFPRDFTLVLQHNIMCYCACAAIPT